MRARKQHHEISDAIVVTALVVVGLIVFSAVMIASLATNAMADEPTPGVEIGVEITPLPEPQHISSCWRVPYKPQYPTELQCQLERLTDTDA